MLAARALAPICRNDRRQGLRHAVRGEGGAADHPANVRLRALLRLTRQSMIALSDCRPPRGRANQHASGGYDVMAACQLPKLNARVRFSLPAPRLSYKGSSRVP